MADVSKSPDYERFELIVNGPALFHAVLSAAELGIFGLLSRRGTADLEEIGLDTGIDSHRLRILMMALCCTGLLEKRDGRFSNTELAEDFFAEDGPDSWRHILLGWQRIYYPAFHRLTDSLRAGTNLGLDAFPGEGTLYQRLALDPQLERIQHRSMAAFTRRSMSGLLENAALDEARHLLDVGGGDGTTALALARRFPRLEVTVFDLPSVTGLAELETAESLCQRVSMLPGDVFSDDFPSGVDTVLFSHFLEVLDPEGIGKMLAKAFDALPKGGRVLIYGFNAEPDETGGPFSARLSLYLNVLATGQGMSYPAADYERWLEAAGFSRVSTLGGLCYEHGLTVGTKP